MRRCSVVTSKYLITKNMGGLAESEVHVLSVKIDASKIKDLLVYGMKMIR